jgi:hypothetical protein
MKSGNLNSRLKLAKRNGSVINRLGKLGDSKNPIFNMKTLPPIEVRWISLNAGEKKTVPHKHDEIQTLIVIIKGRHEVTINKKKKVILSKEADYIFIEPGDLHTWETKKDTLLLVIRWKVG